MASRRALLRHLWAMVQTRATAATLVVKLQRTAVTQGLMMYGIAAMAAMSFMTALIVLIAVAAPPAWRGIALFVLTVALLATAIFAVVSATKKLKRDTALIADFTRGLKLDLAMINLALKDAETDDEDKLAQREDAKQSVRKAAAEHAASGTMAQGAVAGAERPPTGSAAAAMQAAAPTQREVDAAAKVAARAGTSSEFAQESIAADAAESPAGGGAYASPMSAPQAAVDTTEREIAARSAALPEEVTIPGERERERKHGSA